MLIRGEHHLIGVPLFSRICPDRMLLALIGFPVVPCPHVSMKVWIEVCKNSVVHASATCRSLNGAPQASHVSQEEQLFSLGEFFETRYRRICQKNTVARQELGVAQDDNTAGHCGDHRRIFTATCCSQTPGYALLLVFLPCGHRESVKIIQKMA